MRFTSFNLNVARVGEMNYVKMNARYSQSTNAANTSPLARYTGYAHAAVLLAGITSLVLRDQAHDIPIFREEFGLLDIRVANERNVVDTIVERKTKITYRKYEDGDTPQSDPDYTIESLVDAFETFGARMSVETWYTRYAPQYIKQTFASKEDFAKLYHAALEFAWNNSSDAVTIDDDVIRTLILSAGYSLDAIPSDTESEGDTTSTPTTPPMKQNVDENIRTLEHIELTQDARAALAALADAIHKYIK